MQAMRQAAAGVTQAAAGVTAAIPMMPHVSASKPEALSPEILQAIREVCRDEVKIEIESVRVELAELKMQLQPSPPDGGIATVAAGAFNRESSDENVLGSPVMPSPEASVAPHNQPSEAGYHRLRHTETHLVGQDIRKMTVSSDEVINQEYREIVTNAIHEVDFAQDVWGATMFMILKDIPDMMMGDIRLENCLRCGMIMICVALNIFLQFGLLYWIGDLVLLPNIGNLQEMYRKFHEASFESGSFTEDGFSQLRREDQLKVCEMAMSTTLFTAACLFLWVAKCFNELTVVYRRAVAIDCLPTLPSGIAATRMVHELRLQIGSFQKEHKNLVICLTRATRVWLYIMIFIPTVIIACCLLVMGIAFLTATQSFTELIMNSLAMSFVYDIDELLMEVFLPQRLKHNLEITKIMTPSEEHLMHLTPKDMDRLKLKRAYSSSAFKMTMVLAIVTIWLLFQPIIPGYEFDVTEPCEHVLASIRHVACKPWDEDCFPTK